VHTAEYKTNFPHKTVAARVGLGWIEKNGLEKTA